MNTTTALPPLAEFVDADTIQRVNAQYFTTLGSLNWFLRHHRNELVESGALITVAGRLRFHPDRFDRVVVEAGQRNAAASILKSVA